MLGVSGEHVDAVLLHKRDNVRPTGDEGFFVGEADILTSFDGGDGGLETSAANDTGDNTVGVRVGRNEASATDSLKDLRE